MEPYRDEDVLIFLGANDWKTSMLKDFSLSSISSNPAALSTVLTNIAHNHLSSLNQAKFVIDEDPVGESQNEGGATGTESDAKSKASTNDDAVL